MNMSIYILIGMSLAMILMGAPILPVLLVAVISYAITVSMNKMRKVEDKAQIDTYNGKLPGHHLSKWPDRIQHYLPEGAQNHDHTILKVYGPFASVVYPIFSAENNTEIIGYQVDFLMFDLSQKTTHTIRQGHLSFLDEEIENAQDVAIHFWESCDALCEEMFMAEDDATYAEAYTKMETHFHNTYYEIYPERAEGDESPS